VPKHQAFHRDFNGLTPDTLRDINNLVVQAAVDLGFVFRHDDDLGNAPAARLFERIKVGRNDDPSQPLIGYDQYSVTVDEAGMPKGVQVIDII
jgi:hypothetical protein